MWRRCKLTVSEPVAVRFIFYCLVLEGKIDFEFSSIFQGKTTDDSDESISGEESLMIVFVYVFVSVYLSYFLACVLEEEEEDDEDAIDNLRVNDTRPCENKSVELQKSSSYDDLVVPDSPEESYHPSSSSKIVGLTCIPAHQCRPQDDQIPHDEQAEMWATVNKETKSLIQLNDTASVFRTKRNGGKVGKDHVKPKFSFLSHIRGETSISPRVCNMADVLHPADDMDIEDDPITEFPDDFDERSENKLSTYASKEVVSKPLVPPPDKTRLIKRSSKPYSRRGGKGLKSSNKESSSKFQDNEIDDELHGPNSESSSDDDKPNLQSSEPEKKTFMDVFYEAIQASSLGEEILLSGPPQISSGPNMYGRLQQIIKQEKVTDYKVRRKLRSRTGQTDPSSYLDVKIMSRSLEGKLVVCKCFVMDLSGDSLLLKNTQAVAAKETETRIIFNPKVCVNVYIEMGSIVRLHAPWKEIEVKNTNELILLCSYFSNL
ncbi:unnamed protein product [Cochlearia groenlandica]